MDKAIVTGRTLTAPSVPSDCTTTTGQGLAVALPRRGRTGLRLLTAACLSVMGGSALSGCAWTVITTADAIGSVTQAGIAVSSQYSSPTYVTGKPARVKHVCIELNTAVPDQDLVPALRVAFSSYGVTSMVYNPGTAPPDCESKLTYNASLDFGHQEFADGYTRYLSSIDLQLVHGNDIVVAHYQTEGLNTDRFSTTSKKMSGLVRRMVLSPNASEKALVEAAPPNSTSTTTAYAISTNGAAAYATADVNATPQPPVYATPLPNTSRGIIIPHSLNPTGGDPVGTYPSPYATSNASASASASANASANATAAAAAQKTYTPTDSAPPSNAWHPKDP